MFSDFTPYIKERWRQIKNIRSVQDLDADLIRSLVIVLIITLLSYEATDLFYKIAGFALSGETAAARVNGTSYAGAGPQRPQLQDYSVIVDRNLFLTTLKPAGGNESAGGIFDADQKSADFDLKGTIACDASFGYIIVEERASRKQKLYKLGDKIGSGKLIRISRNTATLKNNDREITIKIKETIEGSLMPNTPGAQRSALAPRMPASVRKAVMDNPNQLESIMNQAVVRPFLNKGVREGYIISNIAPNSIYEKAGLQNGDIIIDINDNQLQNANDILQVLESLQSGSMLEMNIKRNGKTETVSYSVN